MEWFAIGIGQDIASAQPNDLCMLVRLTQRGLRVLLTGDLAHFQENYDTNGVPVFNSDHTQTLGSLDRFKKIAANGGRVRLRQ